MEASHVVVLGRVPSSRRLSGGVELLHGVHVHDTLVAHTSLLWIIEVVLVAKVVLDWSSLADVLSDVD